MKNHLTIKDKLSLNYIFFFQQILRVLNGEPYTSIQDQEDSVQQTTDKFSSMRVESGFGSLGHKSSTSPFSSIILQHYIHVQSENACLKYIPLTNIQYLYSTLYYHISYIFTYQVAFTLLWK